MTIQINNTHTKIYRTPLTKDYFEKYQGNINWNLVCQEYVLTEKFIEEYQNELNWDFISYYQKLSEQFIEKFQYKVDWYYISKIQKLSEQFIEKFEDQVNWATICKYQILSEPFIEKYMHSGKITWTTITQYQKLSQEFIHKYELNKYILPIQMSWLYADMETKRKAFVNCNLYEMDGNYVIAYKGIRSDNYSKFNFQYKYELNGIYESNADYNLNEQNSFGLSAWTKLEALQYCNEKLIKVKIHLNDIAALVHDSRKIRCTKFQVIEELS